jgi:hypothetical protein
LGEVFEALGRCGVVAMVLHNGFGLHVGVCGCGGGVLGDADTGEAGVGAAAMSMSDLASAMSSGVGVGVLGGGERVAGGERLFASVAGS